MFGGNGFMMPDHLADDEVQELLREIRIQIGLLRQAAEAFERFFGQAPPRDDGDAALRQVLTS